jgi:hypothetical protein
MKRAPVISVSAEEVAVVLEFQADVVSYLRARNEDLHGVDDAAVVVFEWLDLIYRAVCRRAEQQLAGQQSLPL